MISTRNKKIEPKNMELIINNFEDEISLVKKIKNDDKRNGKDNCEHKILCILFYPRAKLRNSLYKNKDKSLNDQQVAVRYFGWLVRLQLPNSWKEKFTADSARVMAQCLVFRKLVEWTKCGPRHYPILL